MQIRKANKKDSESIKQLYTRAFDDTEAQLVSACATNLLNGVHSDGNLSFVAIELDKLVAHIAFSPVLLSETKDSAGYILAPLAVSPEYQGKKIGAKLVKYGLDFIANLGALYVFVYGDPKYYSRFGFERSTAGRFIPQYKLQYPEGWQAMELNAENSDLRGKIICVEALNDPNLW